jgi:hypothetical protein
MFYIGLSLRGAKRRGNLIGSLMQRLLRSFQSLAMTLGDGFACKLNYARLSSVFQKYSHKPWLTTDTEGTEKNFCLSGDTDKQKDLPERRSNKSLSVSFVPLW